MSEDQKSQNSTTDDWTREDIPALLREFALTDVKPMTLPSKRTRVEMAAADEIDRLNVELAEALWSANHG